MSDLSNRLVAEAPIVVILTSCLGAEIRPDDRETLAQAAAIEQALTEIGYRPVILPFAADLAIAKREIASLRPAFAVNLVERVEGEGRLIALAPLVLDGLRLPYTGAGADAVFLTTNKLLCKRLLASAGIPTPTWSEDAAKPPGRGPWILKPATEDASVGIDSRSVIEQAADLPKALAARRRRFGGGWFYERFIAGREFNLSMIEGQQGSVVLPVAEIRFVDFPPGRPHIVDYAAKWEPHAAVYRKTLRCFDFPPEDRRLLRRLRMIARQCWTLFGLKGYARVDFRVSAKGEPYVLEVNANPSLAPDAGFAAAAAEAGLDFTSLISRLVPAGAERPKPSAPTVCQSKALSWRITPKVSDLAAVRDIIESSAFFSAEEVAVAIELVEERLQRGEAGGYRFIFAERVGRVFGYACYGPIAGTKASFDLYWIAVHETIRRQGLGAKLLRRVERAVAVAGGGDIYVETSSRAQYRPTRAFYAHHAYRRAAFLPGFYGPDDGKVVYVKRIKPSARASSRPRGAIRRPRPSRLRPSARRPGRGRQRRS